jgi:hypothetical protein
MIVSALLTVWAALLPSSCFVSVAYPTWDSLVTLPFNISFQTTALPGVSEVASVIELCTRDGKVVMDDTIEHRPHETVQLLFAVDDAQHTCTARIPV